MAVNVLPLSHKIINLGSWMNLAERELHRSDPSNLKRIMPAEEA